MVGIHLHYVIIGNGGAGISALQTIRDVDKKSDVTIISREKYPAYSPCSLPNLLAGEIDKPTIFRFDKQFYNHLNATFMKNTEALQIIPQSEEVKLAKGSSIKFDKLLIATGAKPITPKKIKGLDLPAVHVMGTLDSTLGILDQIKQEVRHAVVIGGGFMGIETAIMLNERGIKVSIVEMLPHILSRMLDSDISENVAPNIEILDGSGISVNQGVVVDSTMQTNKKNIYAAGDIAEVREQIEGKQGSFAIWPNAIEQGRIAGLNMAEKQTKYDGAEVVNVLDIFDIPVVAMGQTSKDTGKCKVISRFTPQTSKKILLKNDRIVGLQFVGTIRNAGTFYSLMKKGSDISSIQERLLDDNFVIAPDI